MLLLLAFDGLPPPPCTAAALLAAAAAAAAGAAPDELLPPAFDAGAAGTAAATAAALLWPIVAPLLEVARFADMSPEQIEDAVAVKQPIDQGDLSQPLKLYGEDALLDWPGAMDAIICQRDAFMAKALAAAATVRGAALLSTSLFYRLVLHLVRRYTVVCEIHLIYA